MTTGTTNTVISTIESHFSNVDAGTRSQSLPYRLSVIRPYIFTGEVSITIVVARIIDIILNDTP